MVFCFCFCVHRRHRGVGINRRQLVFIAGAASVGATWIARGRGLCSCSRASWLQARVSAIAPGSPVGRQGPHGIAAGDVVLMVHRLGKHAAMGGASWASVSRLCFRIRRTCRRGAPPGFDKSRSTAASRASPAVLGSLAWAGVRRLLCRPPDARG